MSETAVASIGFGSAPLSNATAKAETEADELTAKVKAVIVFRTNVYNTYIVCVSDVLGK